MDNVIAFDAAPNKTGYAYRFAGRWETGVFGPRDAMTLNCIISQAVTRGITRAAIEAPYLGRNVQTLISLARCGGWIDHACRTAGMSTIFIQPSTWQAGLALQNVSASTKEASKWYATRVLAAKEKLKEDEYDAICLCEYVTCHARRQEMLTLTGPRGGKYSATKKRK